MKKWILLTLAIFLLMSQTLTCMAADEPLTVSNVQAEQGQYVYLTVELNKAVTADSIGLTYEYDSKHLKAEPSLCTWGKSGVLSDFDENNNGVWAGNSSEKLEGTVCVLAFKVKENTNLVKTSVSCNVILRNGAQEVGRFAAEGVVSTPCEHSYGPWKSTGSMEHRQVCEKCQDPRTEAHKWDAGVTSDAEDRQGMSDLTYTCTVCAQTKVIQVPAESSQEDEKPGSSEENKNPQQGGTILDNDYPDSSQDTPDHNHSTDNQNGTGNPSDSQNGDSHSQQKDPDDPFYVYDPSDHDHNHDEIQVDYTGNQTQKSGPETVLKLVLLLAIPATAILAAVLYLKKKR